MRSYTIVGGLLSLAAIVSGRTSSSDIREPFEALRSTPEGWHKVGTPDPNKRLHFRIGVTQSNLDLFEQTLYDVSTPDHPKYGQHLKSHQIKELLRPSEDATASIKEWLSDSDISAEDIEDDGDWINFVATVAQAEKMMDTTFNIYESSIRKNLRKVRTLHYSIPGKLHKYIDLIQPTTRFQHITPQREFILGHDVLGMAGAVNVSASCNTTITPTCLRDLYNVKGFTPSANSSGFLGVNGFLEQYARYEDLALFLRDYAPEAVGANFSFTSVNGGVLPQDSPENSVEANLDIDYTVSLSYPIPNTYYSTAGRGPLVPDLDQPTQEDNANEPYLEFFTYLSNLPDNELPQTLTTSYGEDEQSVPASYARRVCNLIGQLGARGVSVIFASGDTGVGSACQTNDGRNTTRFLPIFPAACPFVTSVGGTYRVNPEQAIYFSSGGFSDVFPRPSYQDAAVKKYLSILGDRWEGLYNPDGRGFPDLAAQGQGYRVVDKRRVISVGGTSASAPTVAAIISRISAARIQVGKPPLGFLNPWIYSKGFKGLTDIVNGGSRGCTGQSIYSGLPAPYVPYASWNATEGWDPVTGYGTPDFQKLLELADAAPGRLRYGRTRQ
ncbi:tripeptidyl-peptidase-like protein [Patellaria atrata CBS 101060]|uniref:tripeptidyl-peptidase II n=1 Tax=Patellaria atrata CBS 101060 TaxID=1346257 RepID=A0A9P4SEC4_9PEZI|nr:tripeptidyl-peptidase-like protein [Patellaria atrata CBS 101060]